MINLAIQVLPMHTGSVNQSYAVVDGAIAIIAKSGLKYEVSPFETVMEGAYDAVMKVVKEVKEYCTLAPGSAVIINIKMQSNHEGQVHIEDKMKAYR